MRQFLKEIQWHLIQFYVVASYPIFVGDSLSFLLLIWKEVMDTTLQVLLIAQYLSEICFLKTSVDRESLYVTPLRHHGNIPFSPSNFLRTKLRIRSSWKEYLILVRQKVLKESKPGPPQFVQFRIWWAN